MMKYARFLTWLMFGLFGIAIMISPIEETLITNLGLLRLIQATGANVHWNLPRNLPRKNRSALMQATILLSKSKNNQSARKGLGFIFLLKGQEERALTAWDNAGGMAKLLNQIGLSLPPAKALMWHQRAVRIQPELSDNWFFVGRTYEKLGYPSKSIEAYNQAVRVNTFDQLSPGDLYCRLGKKYFLSWKQYDYALSLFDIALQLDNTTNEFEVSECYRFRGEIYLRNVDEIDKAVVDFQQAILIYPGNHVAYHRLGIAYYKNGKLDLAEQTILTAIGMWPDDKYVIFPYLTLGLIYQTENKNTEAIEVYQKILDIDANNVVAKDSLCKLVMYCDK